MISGIGKSIGSLFGADESPDVPTPPPPPPPPAAIAPAVAPPPAPTPQNSAADLANAAQGQYELGALGKSASILTSPTGLNAGQMQIGLADPMAGLAPRTFQNPAPTAPAPPATPSTPAPAAPLPATPATPKPAAPAAPSNPAAYGNPIAPTGAGYGSFNGLSMVGGDLTPGVSSPNPEDLENYRLGGRK